MLYKIIPLKAILGTVENKRINLYTEIMVSPLKIVEFVLDILFPKFCLNCGAEGNYLCPDCLSLIEVLDRQYCPFCFPPRIVFAGTCLSCKRTKKLAGLYCAASYENFIVKKLIHQFKYEPYLKDLAKTLSSLIITHLQHLNKVNNFESFLLVPAPLHKKKLKQRGFNPAQEIAKEIAKALKIPVINALAKIKQTPAQVELEKEERLENIKGAFICPRPDLGQIKNRKILLVDDVFTTGATMEECALTLKKAGAKEVWGMVVARG